MICKTKEDLTCENCIFSGFSDIGKEDYRECRRTTELMAGISTYPANSFCGEGQWRVEEKVQDNKTRISVCTLDVAIELFDNDGVSPWA